MEEDAYVQMLYCLVPDSLSTKLLASLCLQPHHLSHLIGQLTSYAFGLRRKFTTVNLILELAKKISVKESATASSHMQWRHGLRRSLTIYVGLWTWSRFSPCSPGGVLHHRRCWDVLWCHVFELSALRIHTWIFNKIYKTCESIVY